MTADHRYEGVEPHGRNRFVARCSCGWRSEPYVSAGLAGTAFDGHAESQTAGARN